jgi:hypothetical protein
LKIEKWKMENGKWSAAVNAVFRSAQFSISNFHLPIFNLRNSGCHEREMRPRGLQTA